MNQTIETMVKRSSCMSYKPEQIKKEEIEDIILAGLKAPSGMNKQTPRFVVVTNKEVRDDLSRLNASVMGADIDPFYGAPCVVAVLVKKEITYDYDGSLALGNMLNAAYSMGIGARWIHRAKQVFEMPEGKEYLKKWGVEDDVEGVGFCILGYPAAEADTKEIVPGRVFYVD